MGRANGFLRGAAASAAILLGGAMLCQGLATGSYDAGFWHQGVMRGELVHQVAILALCLPFTWVALREGWTSAPARRLGWVGRVVAMLALGGVLWTAAEMLTFSLGDRGLGSPWLSRIPVAIGLASLVSGRALSARPWRASIRAWGVGIGVGLLAAAAALFQPAACLLGGRMACNDAALAVARGSCALGSAEGCLELGRRSLWDATPRSFAPKEGHAALQRACELGSERGCRDLAGEIEVNYAARDPGVGEKRRALVAKLPPAPDRLAPFRLSDTGGTALAVDGARAYVVGNRALVAVPLDGGAARELLPHANTLALDADHVYAATPDGIVRIPKSGGAPEKVVSVGADDRVETLTVDGEWLYWVEDPARRRRDTMLKKAPKAGGPALDLGVACDQDERADALVADGGRLYWVASLRYESDSFTLHSSDESGGSREILAADGTGYEPSLAIGGGDIFYLARGALTVGSTTHGGVDAVHRISEKKGWLGRAHALVTLDESPVSVAVDTEHVYWLNRQYERNASVVRANRNGGDRKLLLEGIEDATALAVTDRVYVLTKKALYRVAQ